MPTPEEAAGHEIRRLRIARGWSQEQVAERMKAYGYEWHQVMVGRIEAAQRPLRLNEAVDLGKLFGVSVERLMWSNGDLAPEEIDAAIDDARRRLQVAEADWEKLRDRKEALTQDLLTARDDAREAQARMTTVRGELDSLMKRRGGARPRGYAAGSPS
jgi:transcriptional regulator with XRE-family HTH domain